VKTLSLFSGCLGFDTGLARAGFEASCLVEIDPDCARVYRARCPELPLIRDVKRVSSSRVGAVEVVAGGFPCQDLSYAGRGAGLVGDRSGLWFEMIRVIGEVAPRLVVVENVPGLLTRGIVVVTHDLARAGYAGRWFSIAAAEVGAPHRRERVFLVAKRVAKRGAELADASPLGLFSEDGWVSPQVTLFEADLLRKLGRRGRWTLDAIYEEDPRMAISDDEVLLPTPSALESTPTDEYVEEVKAAGVQADARLYLPGRRWHAQRTLSRIAPALLDQDDAGVALLPTPGAWLGRRPENASADPERAASREHDGIRGKRSLELPEALAAEVDTGKLLPTPTTQDGANNGGPAQFERNSLPLNAVVKGSAWGVYGAAVARWAAVCGREPPAPTDAQGKLNPAFVEWMMDLPDGWTAVPGVTRTARLRMLGNSVVPAVGARVGRRLHELDKELQ
jgi:DNA (cytosine-5)-methyltransferase 1